MDSCTLVISSGKTNVTLPASYNKVLCQYMHEITEIVLYIPKREAYKVYKKQCKNEDNISEEEWEKSYEKHLMFKFWNLVLKLELLLLKFVKSL